MAGKVQGQWFHTKRQETPSVSPELQLFPALDVLSTLGRFVLGGQVRTCVPSLA